MMAWRVAMLVMLAGALAPVALVLYMFSTTPGPPVAALVVFGVLAVPPFVASGIVVGAMRDAPGARVAGFFGGAVGGLLVTLVGVAVSAAKTHVDWAAVPIGALVFVTGGAFLCGVGGVAGSTLAGGVESAPALVPTRAARTREGRCGQCGALVTPHALQCAQCGAWTEAA